MNCTYQNIVDKHKESIRNKTITTKEFQEMYKIKSLRGAQKIVKQPDFPKVKVSGCTLIITSQVEAWFIKNIGLEL